MWKPQNVEACLHALSLIRLGKALLGPGLRDQRGSAAELHLICMVLLAILTLFIDRRNPDWFKDQHRYTFRACGQAGLAQGLLALPTLATAIFIATRSWWWQQAGCLFVASSFQILLWYIWTSAAEAAPSNPSAALSTNAINPTAHLVALTGSQPSSPSTARSRSIRARVSFRGPFLTAAAAGTLLSAASALLHAAHPPPPSSPHLLLPGSVFELPRDIATSAWALQTALLLATAPALDHLATDLPRSFTPGEAGILLQSLLALAAGSMAYLAGALRQGAVHVLWSPHVVQPDPGMHVPAFCMLVLFWVLVLAGCCAVTLGSGSGSGGGEAGVREGQGEVHAAAGTGTQAIGSAAAAGGAADSVKEEDRGRTATLQQARGGRPAAAGTRKGKASNGTDPRGSAAAAAAVAAAGAEPVAAGPLERLDSWVDGLIGSAVRLVAAAGAVVSFGLLVDLALWVLGRFVAASSQPRLATLAYWFGCLGVAVPLMYTMSKASAAAEQRRKQPQPQREPGRAGAGAAAAPPTGAPGAQGHLRNTRGGNSCVTSGSGLGHELPSGSGMGSRLAGAVLRALAVPHIVMRKGYHLLAILLFLPAFGWDVRMLQASLAVAGAVLVFVEVLRCLGPARLRAAIGGFMADFADARDSGPLYVTHFTLLLGIALPVWLCEPVCGGAAGAMMAGLYGSEAAEPLPLAGAAGGPLAPPLSAAAARLLPSCRTVLGLSGLVSLGSGDTAAACVGFLLGRRRMFRGGRKTWEGTVSGAAAMLASWGVVVWWMGLTWALTWRTWGALAAVTASVALLEAVTQQLDNVVVPLYYLAHLVLTMTGN